MSSDEAATMDRSWLRVAVALLVYLAVSGGFLAAFFGGDFDAVGDNREQRHHSEYMERHTQPRCRVVFVVIDALRAEFLDRHESLPFLSSLQQNGSGLVFASVTKTPTVTLPRTKCLLTGSVPSYLDLLDNYGASQLASTADSWVSLAAEAGLRLVFYGDKTWLQLLPHAFIRYQAFDPFNVYDYTEVDNNITHYARAELSALSSWDAMALHYVGVDHIGHVYGPDHPLMSVKLRQMDSVLHSVYDAISSDKQMSCSVMVVCGDHGMTSSGSHGGASHHETHAALAFYSSHFQKYNHSLLGPLVQQVDVAATLSALLGLPPPRANIGRLVWSVVRPLLGFRAALAALVDNARQMAYLCQQRHCSSLSDEVLPLLNDIAAKIGDERQSSANLDQLKSVVDTTLDRLQQALGADDNNNNISNIAVYILCLTLLASTVLLLVSDWRLRSAVLFSGRSCLLPLLLFLLTVVTLTIWLTLCRSSAADATTAVSMLTCSALFPLSSALCLLTLILVFSLLPPATVSIQPGKWRPLTTVLAITCCVQPLSLFSSSLVEEEHQLWFQLLSTSWLLMLWSTWSRHVAAVPSRVHSILTSAATCYLAPLLLTSAVLRRYNHNGDKWRHLPALRDFVFDGDYDRSWQWVVAIVALWFISRRHANGLALAIISLLCLFRWHRIVLVMLLLVSVFGGRRGLLASWVWLGVVVCRPANLPVWVGVTLLTTLLSHWLCVEESGGSGEFATADRSLRIAALFYSVGQAAFFYMGNSNSPATVDIASGYTVWEEHNTAAAVFFTLSHTMLAPVLATLAAFYTARRCRCWSEVLHWLAALHGLPLFASMLILVWFRHHLFVWSVFTPKLFYEVCHCATFVAVSLVDSLVFLAGGRVQSSVQYVARVLASNVSAKPLKRQRQTATGPLPL